MWQFEKKDEPTWGDILTAEYEHAFGKGSWAELEANVMGRLKERDPWLYAMLKEDHP